tara:strand:- start:195 stop:824 length:630 start_codon:yes stop_codon:yes gene_type:complete
VALVTASASLEIRFDVGINYVVRDYVVADYLVEGTPALDLDFGSTLIIASGTVSASAIKQAVGPSSLSITTGITVEATEFDEASATLSATSSTTVSAVATLGGTTNLNSTASIDATALRLLLSGSDLVIAGGTVTIGTRIFADPFNTYKVLQETRTIMVPEESRLIKLLEENRVNTIPVETRTLKVLQETRDFKILRPKLTTSGLRRNS